MWYTLLNPTAFFCANLYTPQIYKDEPKTGFLVITIDAVKSLIRGLRKEQRKKKKKEKEFININAMVIPLAFNLAVLSYLRSNTPFTPKLKHV